MLKWINKIHNGNCIQVMRILPENSINCIVTDPPYGIAFMGKQWDKALPNIEAFKQMYRVLKPGALAFVMSSPRQDVLWRMMQMLEEVGFQLRQSFISWIYKTGFPKALDIGKNIDKKYGAKRKKKRLKVSEAANIKARQDTRPYIEEAKKKGFHEIDGDEPITDLAKKWNGWKSITGLKPALECILMVNKPMSESTIVDNVLKHGTGAVNVDACRIPFNSKENDKRLIEDKWKTTAGMSDVKDRKVFGKYKNEDYIPHSSNKGRFPANLLVSDKALDTGNIGDQSRYFDLDAWAKYHGFLDVPKPSKKERDRGLEKFKDQKPKYGKNFSSSNKGSISGSNKLIKNIHPTVKPIKLMAYLIELGCSKKGIVLDPFVGSGTTCIAAKMLNRKFIGIELNEEYAKIASARLENVEVVKYDSSKSIEIKPIKKVTKSKGLKPKCGFKGKCNFKNDNGECIMKRHCKDKVI